MAFDRNIYTALLGVSTALAQKYMDDNSAKTSLSGSDKDLITALTHRFFENHSEIDYSTGSEVIKLACPMASMIGIITCKITSDPSFYSEVYSFIRERITSSTTYRSARISNGMIEWSSEVGSEEKNSLRGRGVVLCVYSKENYGKAVVSAKEYLKGAQMPKLNDCLKLDELIEKENVFEADEDEMEIDEPIKQSVINKKK